VTSSLTARIVTSLIVAQIVGFASGWMIIVSLGVAGVSNYSNSWSEVAAPRTARLVIDSLRRDEAGALRIDPTPQLRDEMNRAPALKFAVFDVAHKAPVAGSSAELVELLGSAGKFFSNHMHFVLPGDPEAPSLGTMEPRRSPYGRMYVAVYRSMFRWEDVFYDLRNELDWDIPYFAAETILTIIVAWLGMRWGLAPIRAVARQARRIDMNSIDQRLSKDRVPDEILPLIDAVNEALARVDQGVARQRIFTANAAHELRTPLAIMRARLENARQSRLRDKLLGDASKLRVILEQMLIAARLTERQAPLSERLDLVETVQPIVSDFFSLAIENDCGVEFEAFASPVECRANKRAVECVIGNLIDNAVRAQPAGGTVQVRVRGGAIVEVVDHGEGVAPCDRELIFEPFWRKNENKPGTGLGLAIAKEVLDKLGGRIWVEETPGGGATFKVAFPQSG
jgi:signal transduction histidine kinase